MGARRDDVREHLVGGPLAGLRALGKVGRWHRVSRGPEISHRRADLVDHRRGGELGPLRFQVAADAELLVRHGAEKGNMVAVSAGAEMGETTMGEPP